MPYQAFVGFHERRKLHLVTTKKYNFRTTTGYGDMDRRTPKKPFLFATG